jgi:membrane protease YdiL (CAAX protease family)
MRRRAGTRHTVSMFDTTAHRGPDAVPSDVPDQAAGLSGTPAQSRRYYALEASGVLGVSLGMSAIYALLYLIRAEITVKGGIAGTTATVVSGAATTHHLLDLADDLANILNGLFPALLALVLLFRDPAGRGFSIGFDRLRLGRDALQGLGFCALIGIPGLGLVWGAHELGLAASLDVVSFPDVWYRVPYLLTSAFQNGALEEVVMIGYLLTRLRQMGVSDYPALATSAVIRGGYHLYQGWGGFFGNLVMGLIFGWWFQRTKRVLPLLIAHFLLDAFSFVGYIYLKRHISWI